jgi:hypothetical protein
LRDDYWRLSVEETKKQQRLIKELQSQQSQKVMQEMKTKDSGSGKLHHSFV